MIKAVLFDLDGTLLDTAPDFATVLNIMRRNRDQAPIPYAAIRATVSDGARALVQLGFGLHEGENGFEELRAELLDLYSRHLADETRLFPGMAETLADIENRGLQWGIVTNKPSAYALPLLEKLSLAGRSAVTVCPDHVRHRKPDPESIHFACETLGCGADQVIYVGDHRRDIETGRNAGAATVACNWGYVHDEDPPAGWLADFTIDRAEQLIDILESL